ncbi:hypothetical protein [Aliterella atlantica]|uniref:hypothetical protein n=1 Tax=Aliterella atlantica TaxID=1827278 RepID=UPI001364C93F|nr:hypothetical protein [Aliterella atlantica]
MNTKLDRRLGMIWDTVKERLGKEETNKFLDLVIKPKDFDDLPQRLQGLSIRN